MNLLLVAWSCAVQRRRGKRGKGATLNDGQDCVKLLQRIVAVGWWKVQGEC